MKKPYKIALTLFYIFLVMCVLKYKAYHVDRKGKVLDVCIETDDSYPHKALVATHYKNLNDLKKVINIEYKTGKDSSVYVRHCFGDSSIQSYLVKGVTQGELLHAKRKGDIWDKLRVVTRTPYSIIMRDEFRKIFILARRRNDVFGKGDVAYYDFAETMVEHINKESAKSYRRDTTPKGFINTFNHITAQALITTIYGEAIADFIGDLHERHHMPQLSTGKFTKEQLTSKENNPIDNYVDLINNEYGQELGKKLRSKYSIKEDTRWTPKLLTDYLNDIQSYYEKHLGIKMKVFKETDRVIQRFCKKMNVVLFDEIEIKKV